MREIIQGRSTSGVVIAGENDYKWMPVGITGLIGRSLLLFGALTGSGVVELPDLTTLFGKKPLSIDEETLLLAQNQQGLLS